LYDDDDPPANERKYPLKESAFTGAVRYIKMASEYGFALFSASHSITINILTAAFSVYMGAHLSNKMLSTAVLFLLTSLTVARADEPKPDHSGPFYPYKPSFYGNIAAGGAMSLMFFISLIYMFVGSRKDKWAWVLPLGTASMGIGSLERVYLRDHHVFIIYRASQLLVSCLPVAFLAFNYIVFGRFVTAIQGYNNPKDIPANTSDCKYSPISASKVGMIFVTSDLVTLFIVVTGSALSLSEYSDLAQDGADIFLFGTVLQIVSYGIFSILVFITHGRMFKQDKKRFSIFNLKEPCVQIFALLYISGLCIMLRSFYRLVEVALGTKTKLVFEEVSCLVSSHIPNIFTK
jgi:hypothetical protein